MPSSPKCRSRYPLRSSAAVGALLTMLGACGPGEFPELDGAFSPFNAMLDIEPAAELEVGQELSFTLSVFHEADLLTDAMPELEFTGPEMGTITITPGTEAGVYVGTHTFNTAGTYTISIHFTAEGADQELQITVVINAPDEH